LKELARYGLMVCAAVGMMCALPAAGSSQELNLYHSVIRADMPELGDAGGYGVFAGFPVRRLQLRAGLQQHRRTTLLETNVCIAYDRNVGCRMEQTERATRLRGLVLTGALPLRPIDQLTVEVGTGITLNHAFAQDRTESGRPNALFVRPTGQWGALLTLGARVRPLNAVPLTLNAAVGAHRIWLTACGEYAWDDDPFCGTTNIRDVRIGGSLDLGR
jgi:hypothetical protein